MDGGWGRLHLTGATVNVGQGWSDDGSADEDRGLKHRSRTATRTVPVPPPLAELLAAHLDQYGTSQDGRLFVTRRGPGGVYMAASDRPVSNSAYTRVWSKARQKALSGSQERSLLAKVPYHLRHAAVSLWLNAGVPPTQVADWAGHSVHVLLKVYAKCLDGQDEAARHRIAAALTA
jgi:integrase